MQEARRSDKREIVTGCAPGAPDAEERRRFSFLVTPPPVVLVSVRGGRCFPPEPAPPSGGMGVARTEMDAFLILCNSSSLKVFAMQGWESRPVPKWV